MDDNTFWINVLRAIVGAFVALVLSVAGCTAYESKRVADAIELGVNPIDARCGIAGTANSGAVICTVRAARNE